MIDHTGIVVRAAAKSRAFYERALAPLGHTLVMQPPQEHTGGRAGLGFGVAPKTDLWLTDGTPDEPRIHIAFAASNREQVDAFHAAAVASGGADNGAPGVRPHYHPNDHGALVLDPDGHNVEAVFHGG